MKNKKKILNVLQSVRTLDDSVIALTQELLKRQESSKEIVNDVVKGPSVAMCPECYKVWIMLHPEQMRYCPGCGKMVNFQYIV
jgi:hypothetical protein